MEEEKKEVKVTEEEYLKLKRGNEKKKETIIVLIFILFFVILVSLVFYLTMNRDNSNKINDGSSEKTISNEKTAEPIIINNALITKLERIEITDNDQIVKIGEKEYKIKKEITVDGAFLLIDDAIRELWNLETAYAEYAYVTDKYILFTVTAQDWESITYAINEEGHQILTNDNEYQIHDLKIIDGVLHASGHIFCGADGDCPDKDLVIVYAEDKITVNEAK